MYDFFKKMITCIYKLLLNKITMVNNMNFNKFTRKLDIGDDILTESIITGYEIIFESEFTEFMQNIYKLDVNKQRELLENGYSPSNALVDRALSTLLTKVPQKKMDDDSSSELVVKAKEMKSLLNKSLTESFSDKLVGGITKVIDGVGEIIGNKEEPEKNDDESSSELVESTTEEVIEMAETKLGPETTESELDDPLSEDKYVDAMDDSDELLDEEYSLPEDQDTDEFDDIDAILAEIDL